MVFLPQEHIAATGDLLVNPIPFGIGSYYADWIATLARVDSLDASILFPGHGAVQRDRNHLHEVQGLLRALVDSAKAVVADSGTLEDAQRRITLADWRRTLAGDDPADSDVRRHVRGASRRARVAPGARRARRRDRPHGQVTRGGTSGLRSVTAHRHVFAMIRPIRCAARRVGPRTRRVALLPHAAHGQKPPPGYDAYVAQVLKAFAVPGVAVAIVKDGKVVLAKGYGVRRLGDADAGGCADAVRHRLEHQALHRHGARASWSRKASSSGTRR